MSLLEVYQVSVLRVDLSNRSWAKSHKSSVFNAANFLSRGVIFEKWRA